MADIEITSDINSPTVSNVSANTGATIESTLVTGGQGNPGYTPVKGVDYFDGEDGRDIEIQNDGTYINWRPVGETAWTPIIAVASLTGTDGREVELFNNGTTVQWRYSGEGTWNDLLDISAFTGDMSASTYDPQGLGVDAFSRANHTGEQAISTVTGLQTALNAKQASGDYATNSALTTGLASKAAANHTHAQADVTGLATTLAGKSDTTHLHDDRYYVKATVDAYLADKFNNAGGTITGAVTYNVPAGYRQIRYNIPAMVSSGAQNGSVHYDNTSNPGHAVTVYSNYAGAAQGAMFRMTADNAAFDKPVLEITNKGTAGSATGIRLNGPRPEIEFWEDDQTAPAGAFELRVNNDKFQIGTRNAGNTGFEFPYTFYREANGGYVGLGTETPTSRLDVNGTVKATAFVGDGSGLTGISGGAPAVHTHDDRYYTETEIDTMLAEFEPTGGGDTVTLNTIIARQKNLPTSGVTELTGAVNGTNPTFTIGSAIDPTSLIVIRNTTVEPLGESITITDAATGAFTFADAPETGDQIYVSAVSPQSGSINAGIQSIVAGDNVTVDATDPANPIVSAAGGGGGGGGEIVVGTLFQLNGFNMSSYNVTGVGSGQVLSGRNPQIRSLSTENSYAKLSNITNTDPQNWENFNLWGTNFRASASFTQADQGTDGLFLWGVGDGWNDASDFNPYRFVGFRMDRDAGVNTWKVISANGDGNTTTTVATPAYPYGLHFYLSVKKTQTEVVFYLNGQVVATHTTHVPDATMTMHQSNPIYLVAGNKASTSNNAFNIYNHRVDFIA